jgi:hypothetical protein
MLGRELRMTKPSAADTPEFRLLAECCRRPMPEHGSAAIRAAAANVGDWDRFLWLANRHRVAGLVHEATSSAQAELPPAAAEELAARARHIGRRNAILLAETLRLQRALDAAEIPCLMLKGVALAQLAYGTLATKHARDIDLLVPPDHAAAALHILEREGYALSYPAARMSEAQSRAVFRYAREVQLLHRGNRLLVELHWRPTNNPLLLKGIDAHAAAQSVALGDGVGIRTLATADLFAYLCVHGAQHAWSRLKWLADFNALAAANAADLQRLYRHAQSIGAGRCAGQALLLCNRLFALSLPAALNEEIGADRTVERLARIAVETMSEDYAEAESGRSFGGALRVLFAQFLLGKGWAFLVAQHRAESVRTLDVVDVPLPPALQFLYPFLRLPLWLWRRAKFVAKSAAGSARALGSKP